MNKKVPDLGIFDGHAIGALCSTIEQRFLALQELKSLAAHQFQDPGPKITGEKMMHSGGESSWRPIKPKSKESGRKLHEQNVYIRNKWLTEPGIINQYKRRTCLIGGRGARTGQVGGSHAPCLQWQPPPLSYIINERFPSDAQGAARPATEPTFGALFV